jgi:cytochrome c553
MRTRAYAPRIMLALAALLLSLGAQADGDAAKGKVDAYACIGCHGVPNYTNQYPNYRVPQLAGQQAAYIVQALREYKAGDRAHKTMHAQASSLSDQQMQDIAAYFESLGHAPASK